LNRWGKIEEFLNNLLLNFSATLKSLGGKATPSKAKKSWSKGSKSFTFNKDKIKSKAIETSKLAVHKVKTVKENTQKRVIQVKATTNAAVMKVQKTNVKELSPTKIIATLVAFIAPTFIKLKTWYLSIRPETVVTFVTLSAVGALGGLNIYKESKEISEQKKVAEGGELVEEVKNATAASRRPAYFRKKEKQFKVSNVVLPAYLKSSHGISKLVIDFTFEGSNKYIKSYFWENPHQIQDVMNSTLEPISVDFPLTEEGKTIIKKKLIKEMNIRIKKLGIKGGISDVHIDSIIGG
jgi:hypothetical protein